ncbi:MAG: hypothetical protein ACLFT0_15555 [Spirulinaceae cyanobacterium]
MTQEYQLSIDFSQEYHNDDLLDLMYRSCQNAAISEVYRENALIHGDIELANLFDRIKDQNHLNASKAREVLFQNELNLP